MSPISIALLKTRAYIESLIRMALCIESSIAEFWTGESIAISKQYSSIIFSMHHILSFPSSDAETKDVFSPWIGLSEVTLLECPLNT